MLETRPLSASFVAEVAGLDVRGPIKIDGVSSAHGSPQR
jgi:hypothetical protein